MKHAAQANLALFTAAVFWGFGFVFARDAMRYMSPLAFSGLRFSLGCIPLVIAAIPRARRQLAAADKRALCKVWMTAIPCAGVLIFLGTFFQQYGMVWTSAGKAGFITSLYVIIVPFMMALAGARISPGQALGALLAVAGLYLLSSTGSLSLGQGDGYVIIGAFLWAGHVLCVGHFSPRMDFIILGAGQAAVCAAVAVAATVICGEFPSLEMLRAAWVDIVWGGIFSVTIGFTLQVLGQKNANPAAAALILQLEAAVAAVAGWIFLDEYMTGRMILGALIMTAGIVICELWRIFFPGKNRP